MKKLGAGCLVALALMLAAPVAATAGPSLRATPDRGEVGDSVALKGRGWIVGSGCVNKVVLFFKQGGHRLNLGSASTGGGRFTFHTHYQQAEPGAARFVARQDCVDRTYRRAADVTIGGDENVAYRGETERGGRVSFIVVDGSEIRKFRFVNRCSSDRKRGSLVPGGMPIGDISFSRRGKQFTIFGRFGDGGRVTGRVRERAGGCDSGTMGWTAHRVS